MHVACTVRSAFDLPYFSIKGYMLHKKIELFAIQRS